MQDNTRVDAAGGNLLAGAGHAPWGGLPGPGPAIEFVPHEAGKYLEVFRALLAQGTRQFTVQGWSPEVRAFLALAGELKAQHTFELQAFGEDLKQACIEGLPVRAAMPDAGAVFLFMPSGPALSTALMQYAEAQHVVLCAPITEHYFDRRPLLIQSVPKCGTHLLFEVAKAMGYGPPPSLDLPAFEDELLPGHFYNLQHLRLESLGQPYARVGCFADDFAASPVPFIYRDPRDVAVSMAHYLVKQKDYHLLSSYMESLRPAQRLATVITGDYPIPVYINRDFSFRGTIRDLMMAYADWVTRPFGNVLPIRFEDIVGPAGGGNEQSQLKTLWRLQLALHVPGRPGDFVRGIFNTKSLTFRKGRIGSYRDEFGEEHDRLFQSLPQDFMQIYGYDGSAGPEGQQAEKHVAAFFGRYRGTAGEMTPPDSSCLLVEGYRGFNIVRFKRQCIGVAQELGSLGAWPLPQDDVDLWMTQGKWIVGKSCNEVRAAIDYRLIQGLQASLRGLENLLHGLESSLRENRTQLQYLREDVLAVHSKLTVRYYIEKAKRLFEKIVPLSRLRRLLPRRTNIDPPRKENIVYVGRIADLSDEIPIVVDSLPCRSDRKEPSAA